MESLKQSLIDPSDSEESNETITSYTPYGVRTRRLDSFSISACEQGISRAQVVRKSKKRRRMKIGGLLLCAAVVVGVLVGVFVNQGGTHSTPASERQRQEDNDNTQKMASKMKSGVSASGQLNVDQSMLDGSSRGDSSELINSLKASTGSDHIVFEHATVTDPVPVAFDALGTTQVITVTGTTSVYGVDAPVTAKVWTENNKVKGIFLMDTSGGGSNNKGRALSATSTLADFVPAASQDDAKEQQFDKINVQNAQVLFSSANEKIDKLVKLGFASYVNTLKTCGGQVGIVAGSNFLAHGAAAGFKAWTQVSENLLQVQEDIPFDSQLCGQIAPDFNMVSGVVLSKEKLDISKTVWLSDLFLRLNFKQKDASAGAIFNANFGAGSGDAGESYLLKMNLTMNFNADKEEFDFDAHEVSSDWQLPGFFTGLSVGNLNLATKFSHSAQPKFSGNLGASVTWQKDANKIEAPFSLSWPYTANGFSVEARPEGTLHLTSFPGFPTNAPELDIVDSSLTFSLRKDGTESEADFTFSANLLVKDSEGLSALESMTTQAPPEKVGLKGVIKSDTYSLEADLANFQFSENLDLSDAKIQINSVAPHVKVDATLTVGDHTSIKALHGAKATISAVIDGSNMISFDGDLAAKWNMNVGDDKNSVAPLAADVSVHINYDKQAQPTTSSFLKATFALESSTLTGEIKYPNMDECFEMNIRLEDPQHNMYALIDRLLGLNQDQVKQKHDTLSQPSFNDLLNTKLDSLQLVYAPVCGNLSIDASASTTNLGSSLVSLDINADRHVWFWDLVIQPPLEWTLADTKIGGEFFNSNSVEGVTVSELAFAFSDAQRTIDIRKLEKSGSTVQKQTLSKIVPSGASVFGVMTIDYDAKDLVVLKSLSDKNPNIDIEGHIDENVVRLDGDLDGTLSLGDGKFKLTRAHIHIASVEPFLSVSGHFVTDQFDHRLGFDVSGVVRKNEVDFSGALDTSAWNLTIFHEPLVIDDVILDTKWKFDQEIDDLKFLAGSSISGDGHIDDLKMQVGLKLWPDKSEAAQLTCILEEEPTLSSLAENTCGSDGIALQDGSSLYRQADFMKTKFREARASIAFDPVRFQADAAIDLFGTDNLAAIVKITKKDAATGEGHDTSLTKGDWNFALGVAYGNSFSSFADVVPDMANAIKRTPQMANVALVLTTVDQPMQFIGVPEPYQAKAGLNFFGSVDLTKLSNSSLLVKWGFEEALVAGLVDDNDFDLQGGLDGEITIYKDFKMTEMSFFMAFHKGGAGVDMQYGVMSKFRLALKNQDLDFQVKLWLSPKPTVAGLGFGIDGSTLESYTDAFGVKGLTLHRTELEFEMVCDVNPVTGVACTPSKIGVGTGIDYNGVGGDGDVFVNVLDPTQNVIYFELDNIDFEKIINAALTGLNIDASLHNSIFDISFKRAVFQINTDTVKQRFNGKIFEPGYLVEVDEFNLWEMFKGTAKVQVWTAEMKHGFQIYVDLAPIHIGGWFTLSGAKSADDPAVLDIAVMDHPASTSKFQISAGLDLLGNYVSADVLIDDRHFDLAVDMSLVHDLFDFKLDAHLTHASTVKVPLDWNFEAEMNQGVLDWFGTEMPQLADDMKQDCDSKIQDWQNQIDDALATVDSWKKKIADRLADDTLKINKKLIGWEGDVHEARNKVDHLQGKIDDYSAKINDNSHHWWQKPKKVYYEGLRLAVEALKGIADGVLTEAIKVLKAAEASAHDIAQLDPQILAWRAEKGIAHGVLVVAQKGLETVKTVICDDLTTLLADVGKAIANTFNIEYLSLSGGLKDLMQGEIATVGMKAVFFGHHVDTTYTLNPSDLVSLAKSIWMDIVDLWRPATKKIAQSPFDSLPAGFALSNNTVLHGGNITCKCPGHVLSRVCMSC
jgi:hypothetical protein